jgi:hypothetical protein
MKGEHAYQVMRGVGMAVRARDEVSEAELVLMLRQALGTAPLTPAERSQRRRTKTKRGRDEESRQTVTNVTPASRKNVTRTGTDAPPSSPPLHPPPSPTPGNSELFTTTQDYQVSREAPAVVVGGQAKHEAKNTRVPCPPDLALAEAQLAQLALEGIDPFHVEYYTRDLCSKHADGAELRPLETWRRWLIGAIRRTWTDPTTRVRRPEAAPPARPRPIPVPEPTQRPRSAPPPPPAGEELRLVPRAAAGVPRKTLTESLDALNRMPLPDAEDGQQEAVADA